MEMREAASPSLSSSSVGNEDDRTSAENVAISSLSWLKSNDSDGGGLVMITMGGIGIGMVLTLMAFGLVLDSGGRGQMGGRESTSKHVRGERILFRGLPPSSQNRSLHAPPKPQTQIPPNQNNTSTMSGQYGDPDWANPSAPSSKSVVESSAWTSTTGGEDFSGAAISSGGGASNVNAAGLGNNASHR